MTGFEAIAAMFQEEGKIVAVRLDEDVRLNFDDIKDGQSFKTSKADLEAEGWELGYKCETCDGDGVIEIPCPRCAHRSLHSLLENPCCGGWDEKECNDCEGGTRWETETTGGAH